MKAGSSLPAFIVLEKGNYTYFCDPHESEMNGSFKVG